MKIFSIIVLAALAAAIITISPLVDTAHAADGKDIFQARCQACHGAAGTGNEALAKVFKIELSRLDLTKDEMKMKSESELMNIVKSGKGRMPALGDGLNDADIRAVIQFIRSFAK